MSDDKIIKLPRGQIMTLTDHDGVYWLTSPTEPLPPVHFEEVTHEEKKKFDRPLTNW